MRRAISLVALLVLCTGIARAAAPSVADLDAHSRATGNRLDVAMAVGEHIFATRWPAQVLQVEANEISEHLVLGLHVSGVKFHSPLNLSEFKGEVRSLVSQAFAAAPSAEEVDVWVTVPISVGKGVIVSGDLAKPTTRTVYTISARRDRHVVKNTFLDEDWAATAFKKAP